MVVEASKMLLISIRFAMCHHFWPFINMLSGGDRAGRRNYSVQLVLDWGREAVYHIWFARRGSLQPGGRVHYWFADRC